MFRASKILLLHGLALTTSFAAPSANAQDYVTRSEMCVAQIQRLNPSTHIRNGLSANDCPLEAPPTLFKGAPINQWLASGADCETDMPDVPDCGLTSNLVDALPGAARRIKLGNGRCLHVLPVMLTDKTEAFKCNATKARPACVTGVRQDGATTVVTLASSASGGASTANIIIPANPEQHLPLFAKSRGGPLMTLIPAEMTIGGAHRDAQGFLQHYINHTISKCDGAAAYCREQASAQADRAIGELIRRAWNPRPLVSKEDRAAEYKSLKDTVLAADLGPNSKEKKLYARAILENEVSGSSPYQVLDAVIRNSSLSWGAHQIDIGANETSEVDLFWNTIRKWRQSPGTGDFPGLREADQFKQCLSQPGRAYFVDQIALYLRTVPDMNKALRSDKGKAAYNGRFKDYLREEVAPALALKGLFKKSPFAWLYYIDQRNQRGTKVGVALKTIGQALSDDELGTCENIAAGEDSLVAEIKRRTKPSDHYDVDRRVANLHTLLRQEYGDNLGRNCGG